MTLKGKNVLVTGASKGIGRACAEAFASQGANVVINYSTDKAGADETSKLASKPGVKTLVVQADITNSSDVERMFTTIKQGFRNLDIVINNAGVFIDGDAPGNLEITRQVFETNFFGQISVTNAALELLDTGKIIFMSSIFGRPGHGSSESIGYSASKAALNSYVKNLAKSLAPRILVNAIAPGRTLTPEWGEMTEARMAELAKGHLIERWIEPKEVASAAVFLAQNDAMCGEVLAIDGGMSLKILG